eukprot:SAG11_NODE_24580_length_371_cov_0.860294_1_plen_57_part_10
MPAAQPAAQAPRQRVSLPELFAAAASAVVRPAATVLTKGGSGNEEEKNEGRERWRKV